MLKLASKRAAVFAVLVGLLSQPAGAEPSFTGLGDLPGGSFYSKAIGVSADGSIVVGGSPSASGFEAFIYDATNGMQGLGDLPGGSFNSQSIAACADGSIVVGTSASGSGTEVFVYDATNGMQGLGDLPGGSFNSQAWAASADCSIIVGFSDSALGQEAFIYDPTNGMQGLGDLPGGNFWSSARGVSADGSIVVGTGWSAAGQEPFAYDSSNGMQGLGNLPGGSFDGQAFGVSADGSIVVGGSESASGFEAFIYDATNGMQGLGDLPGGNFRSSARGVSADGSVVVGWSLNDLECPAFDPTCQFSLPLDVGAAFVWDSQNGMRELSAVLTGMGVDITGWELSEATGVSYDGRTIVGNGTNPGGFAEAWVAVIYDDSTVVPPGQDVSGSLLGGSSQTGGIDFEIADTAGGNAVANFVPAWIGEEVLTELNDPETVNFKIISDPFQLWELEYDGTLTPPVTLTFHYDDTHLFCGQDGQDPTPEELLACEEALLVYHFAPSPDCPWEFFGTAQGGTIDFTVEAVALQVVTTAGQTAAQVAAAVAAAINADPTLGQAGIIALSQEGRVFTNGSFTSTSVNDAGLTHENDCWLPLPLVDFSPPEPNPDTVNNLITVTTESFSQFVLGGPAVGPSTWVFSGTAEGGSIDFTVGAVALQVVTTAGQTAAQVAAAVAAAINGDPLLSQAGITASSTGGEVSTNGPVTSMSVNDPGLTYGSAVPRIPALSPWVHALLSVLLLTVATLRIARPRAT